jgi:ribosomal 50S subunit-associated protein YjgA (DUF615 family)
MGIKKSRIVKPKTTITGIKEHWKKMIQDENDEKIIISSSHIQDEFSNMFTRLNTKVVVTIENNKIKNIDIPSGIQVIIKDYDNLGTNREIKRDRNHRRYSEYGW